ncbi:hypothetical protein EGW08_009003 [Elysia chlorotica]|uniref:Uncharacterized protein n=1 Tax=Elysia chlorotica TaxID=188477 RepID=A0A3S1B9W6_ELYCH|nr:hypothetical protein EGW08_009003 [Elysia chlorotica]
MATAAQKPQVVTVGKTPNGKAGITVSTGSCVTDPELTPSQRRKRPLSMIKESDTDSDASCETLVGRGSNSNSSDSHDGGHRKSAPSLGEGGKTAASSSVENGRTSPRRSASFTARCSPAIRKLTENFERSAGGLSPSRNSVRTAPKSTATTTTTGLRNGKTNASGSQNNISNNNSSNSSNSNNVSNSRTGGASSPRTNSPRSLVNKSTPTPVTKTTRTSTSSPSSPATRAIPPSFSTSRTSSPSQSARLGTSSPRRVAQQTTEQGSRQTSGRGAAGSSLDKKRPSPSGISGKQPLKSSSSSSKNSKTSSRSELSGKLSQPKKSSDCEEPSQDSEKDLSEGKEKVEKESNENSVIEVVVGGVPPTREIEIVTDLGSPTSPTPQRLASLSPGGGDVSPIPRDGGGLARIRETAERLKLTSPSSPLTPSPSNSPKFGHRARFAAHRASPPLTLMSQGSQSPPIPRGGVRPIPSIASLPPSSSSSIPHITVTHSDGSVRGPPPQLGPYVPTNISPSPPYSPSSTPLSAIAESVDPNSMPSDAQDHSCNNNNNISSYKHESCSADNGDSNQSVSNQSAGVSKNCNSNNSISSNNNSINNSNNSNTIRSVLPYNPSYYNRPGFLHGSRTSTSGLAHAQSTALAHPYYKLSSSAFFTRRLSSGGSSIYEEQEEEGEEEGEAGSDGQDGDIDTKTKTEGKVLEGNTTNTTTSCSMDITTNLKTNINNNNNNNNNHNDANANSISPDTTSPASPAVPQQTSLLGSHLSQLKETADKLRLSTRRDSTMAWRQKYLDQPAHMRSVSVLDTQGALTTPDDERLTPDRKQRIDAALLWLREELQDMRTQDQNLARQLLTIRHDIHQLKLQRSTEEHQDLIEEFRNELEELQEFSDVLDLPQPVYGGHNPLKNVGVTRMNLCARRFSAC